MLLLVLTACYKHAHTIVRHGSFGFQYDEPKIYCRRSETSIGFNMECDMGKIVVRFTEESRNTATDSLLNARLDEAWNSCEYRMSELEGKDSQISLAKLIEREDNSSECPTYVAVCPFDAEYFVIVEGFTYGAESKEFKAAFIVLVTTLEPY